VSGTAFPGFAAETLRFLTDLREHNDAGWFAAHRADYERWWLAPAIGFVEAVGPGLREFAPEINADPRINRSIMRINRDVRFTKDKRPYKDHLDLWFWEGPERRSAVSGLFLRLTPEALWVGAGAHHFERDTLAAFREAVADPPRGAALIDAIRQVEAAGRTVHRDEQARQPAGFNVDDPERAQLLRTTALHAMEEEPAAGLVGDPAVVDRCLRRWEAMLPVHRWLTDTLR
jgi:uncharacterized protein (TIGR02453 family)